jgi:hypothetical protein
MKLRDLGVDAAREWFQQLLEWSRKKITVDDNWDASVLKTYLGTAETVVDHTLGRTPRYIWEVASFPHGTAGISFTKEPTNAKLFLKRSTAGECTLILM